GKCHLGAGDIAARILEELIELFVGPLAALLLHRVGEGEAAPALAAVVADDVPKVGADTVGAALLEGVAGLARLGGGLALFHRRARQQYRDRLLCFLRSARLAAF